MPDPTDQHAAAIAGAPRPPSVLDAARRLLEVWDTTASFASFPGPGPDAVEMLRAAVLRESGLERRVHVDRRMGPRRAEEARLHYAREALIAAALRVADDWRPRSGALMAAPGTPIDALLRAATSYERGDAP